MELFSHLEGDEVCECPFGKLLCLRHPKIMQDMDGNIPYMFDCWANLLLLKTSMAELSNALCCYGFNAQNLSDGKSFSTETIRIYLRTV